MRAWSFDEFGLDHLALGERPDPAPGPGQVLLDMRAMSLNYRDLLLVQGAYDPRMKRPLVPCSDGVGEVIAVGDGVRRFEVGDRVCPIFSQTWVHGPPRSSARHGVLGGPLDGTLREQVVIDEAGGVAVPEHLTDEEAACLPCAGVTAWRALTVEGGITAGDTVLTLGTGGVSLFALTLGKLLGARVAITSSSDDKLERARELGADFTVNYAADERWSKAVKEWSGGGVDAVIELAGASSIGQSLRAVRVGGRVISIGNLGGNTAEIALPLIFMRSVQVRGLFVGNRDDFEAMGRALAAHEARPVIDRSFSFDEAPEAFRYMEGGHGMGKIVIAR